MKKIALLTFSLLLTATLFAGCQKTEATTEVAVKDLWKDIEDAVGVDNMVADQKLDDEKLKSLYGVDPDDLEEYEARVPSMNVHAEEFFVAKVKDGKMDKVKSDIETHLKNLDSTWSQYLPDQYELVKNAQVRENGNYILVTVSSNADKATDAFDKMFSKN